MLARLGLREEDIATRCGVTQASVSYWITGTTIPRDRHKLTLRDAFGIPVDAWMTPHDPAAADYKSDLYASC